MNINFINININIFILCQLKLNEQSKYRYTAQHKL